VKRPGFAGWLGVEVVVCVVVEIAGWSEVELVPLQAAPISVPIITIVSSGSIALRKGFLRSLVACFFVSGMVDSPAHQGRKR